MIELPKHIERLLLQNGCVIVPTFGAFVTQHVAARYIQNEHLFLPPYKSVGFNPQLTANDGLLIHAYMETEQFSYTKAESTVQQQVGELVKTLMEEGFYEVGSIGTLTQKADGTLNFSPCEAGVLSPELYGLGSFEIAQLAAKSTTTFHLPKKSTVKRKKDRVARVRKRAILFSTVATAATVLLLLAITKPMLKPSFVQTASFSQGVLKHFTAKRTENAAFTKAATPAVQTPAQAAPALPQPAVTPQAGTFCIVLASAVSAHNAEMFVKQLHEQGYSEASIYQKGKMRRVIYSSFATEAEAQAKLNELHKEAEFQSAWVYALK